MSPASERREEGTNRRWRWSAKLLLGVIVLVAGGVIAAAAAYFAEYRRNFEQSIRDQLSAVADLKAAEIANWRRERLRDSALAASAPSMVQTVGRLGGKSDVRARAQLLRWLEAMRERAGASAVALIDAQGRVQLASEESAAQIDGPLIEAAVEAVRRRQVIVCDLHRLGGTGAIMLGTAAPVMTAADADDPLGAVCLVIDPLGSLYPSLRAWPVLATDAETVLMRREDAEVVYLSNTRALPDAALRIRIPVASEELLASRAIRQPAGVVTGLTLAGQTMLGAARRVGDSGWFVLARIDRDAVYHPLHALGGLLGAMSVVLAVSFVLGGWAWRRQRVAGLLRAQLAEERTRNVLAQRVALLTKHANDIILLSDHAGRILDANDRAVTAYGWSLAELQGLTLPALAAGEGVPAVPAEDTVGDARFETVHARRDGTRFPVEMSVRTVEFEGLRLRQSIIRDVTQRRAAETEIARLTRFHAVLSQVNQAVVLSRSQEELFERVCRAAVEFGRFRLVWIGWLDRPTSRIEPVARAGEAAAYLDDIVVTADDRPEGRGPVGLAARNGSPTIWNDFLTDLGAAPWREAADRFGLRACAAFPLRVAGEVSGALVIYTGEAGVFGEAEIGLMTEVAGDLSFGLDNLRGEARRAQAEAAVRASEWRLRAVIEHAPDAIFVHTGERFVFVNDATVRLFGAASANDLIGTLVMERVHPDYRGLVARRIAQGLVDKAHAPVHEHLYLRLDGTPVAVEVSAAPLEFEGVPAVVVFVRDMSERRRTEQRLAEFGALLDRANDAILSCTLQGVTLSWNKGAERLYGWTVAEAIGRRVTELTGADPAHLTEAYATVQAVGDWVGEIRNVTKTGEVVIVLSRWTLMRDDAGEPVSIFAIDTDITEKKRLEALFLRAQRLESVGHLASGIAHDLNNVLAPVLMGTSMLRAETTNPETASVLAAIEASARRGADIVRQILVFARGEEGQRRVLPLRPLLREVAQIIANTFPKSVALQTSFPRDLWSVEGDPTQLHQLLMNLCVNARDAMPAGGTLTIAAENLVIDEPAAARIPGARPGEFVVWLVADTGVGIPPENLDRIFDPFFTTKGKDKGTGLGLSTSLGIARSHRGFITVASTVGRRTEFRVYLPAVRAATETVIEPPSTADVTGRGETVLLVDDEENVRLMTRRLLERNGYRVIVAGDGEEAAALWTQQRDAIDVVVTDIMMPRMDGAALIRILQAATPGVRIITISGFDDESTKSLRVAARLTKPIAHDRFMRALREVLDMPVPPTPSDHDLGAGV